MRPQRTLPWLKIFTIKHSIDYHFVAYGYLGIGIYPFLLTEIQAILAYNVSFC